ncbi:MAG: acetyl-CoA carboxylase, biotin carboxyl carrier protein [Alphaproteobacteria bacterium]|nr:acetyl-CoA carboxylase, biotin carboxyl carrier protein [Alphaproteobacteria bacterium]
MSCSNQDDCQKNLSDMIDLLSKKLNEHGLTELEFDGQDISLRISKQQNVTSIAQTVPMAGNTSVASAVAPNGHTERSPMVGVAYLAPEPGADNYVEVGKTVKKGDTLCLIEAMKTFNPVKATKDGVVKEILIEAEQMVEFDTPLVVIG